MGKCAWHSKLPKMPLSKDRRATPETGGGGQHMTSLETYLDTLVLLGCEFVGADGSHGDVASNHVLVLVQEGEGVHPAEGGADHHRRGQAQTLAHLPQEGRRGQFSDGCRGLGWLGLTESWGRLETSEPSKNFRPSNRQGQAVNS